MPNVPIIDAHLHLWDPHHFRMSWLDGDAVLDQRYDLPEYDRHSEGVDVAGMVYVQVEVEPPYALLEVDWVAARATADPRLLGMVAWAPLEYGERARAFLDALAARRPLVKGIRRLVQGESDRGFSVQPDFVRGVQMLSEYGFSFDLCITHDQFDSAIALAKLCPDTPIVLDHCGKPAISTRTLDPWRDQMRELASLPHAMCKVSGLVNEADHQNWTPDDLAPYIAHALEVFGEDRVMFGGDWPVALQASTYVRWVETLDALTSHLSEQARAKLWAENARRFYRLTD